MQHAIARRDVLKQLTYAGASLAFGSGVVRGRSAPVVVNGKPVEILVASVSPSTVRLTVLPIAGGTVPDHNALVAAAAGKPVARRRDLDPAASAPIRAGALSVRVTAAPPTIHVSDASGQLIQKLTLDAETAN